jgi:hypothetical protein
MVKSEIIIVIILNNKRYFFYREIDILQIKNII